MGAINCSNCNCNKKEDDLNEVSLDNKIGRAHV